MRYDRGAVLGEWSRTPAGPVAKPFGRAQVPAVEALATAVAQVRAPAAALPPGFRPQHRITVTFAPPVGEPSEHVLELGPPRATGCMARIDGAGATAPLVLCTAAVALARP